MRRYALLAVTVLVSALIPTAAQGQNTCATTLAALDSTFAGQDLTCFELAAFIVDSFASRLYLGVAEEQTIPRDLQSSAPQGAATGGSPAQDEAIPSVQPLALAGGSIAAVGTDAGAHAITALTLNPSLFFFNSDAKEAVAKFSRFTDVTFFFPVDELDQNDDGKVDYFGVRARVNINSFSQGSEIMQKARSLFASLVQQETELADKISNVLETAPDVEKCANAYIAGQNTEQACKGTVSISLDETQYEALREQLQAAREEADAFYYGIDLRFDFGDPTLGEVPGADGTALFGGIAIGKRFVNTSLSSGGIRGRLGIRYVDQDDFIDSTNVDKVNPVKGETNFALEGGFGFELMKAFQQQPIRLSGGFEFRLGDPPNDMDEEFQTNYLLFRASLNIPVTSSNSLSLSVGAPLIGEVTPTLSVNVNWALLLPNK
ncbi:MAG: hypothetical protein ACE5G0_06235 [Rhodothermales bacterium]